MSPPLDYRDPPSLLLVEDDVSQRRTLSKLLQKQGLKVVCCQTAKEAVEQLNREEFAVAILDLHLPDGEGTSLFETFHARCLKTQVIVHTGYGSLESAKKAVDYGIYAYIEKGSDPAYLIAKVHGATNAYLAKSLQESEERFTQIAEYIHEIFSLVTVDFRKVLYVSPAYERIWGRSCESLYQQPLSFLESVHPDDLPALQAAIHGRVSGELIGESKIEYRIIQPDGSERWIMTRQSPVHDENGQVVRLAGVSCDITERKRAEESLKATEEQYRSVFEATTDGLVIFEPEGEQIEVNSAMCRMHGHTRDEFLKLKPPQVLCHDSLHVFHEFLASLNAGRSFRAEAKDIHKDGTEIDVEVNGVPFTYKGRPRLLGIIRDITERKQAEQETRNTLNLLNAVMVGTTDFIYVKDRDSRHLMVNASCVRLLGKSVREIIGKDNTELFPPEIASQFNESDRLTMHAGEPSTYEEKLTLADPNSTRVILSMKAPYRDSRGNIIGVIGISRDITERKQAEAQLQKLSAVVEHSPASILITDKEGLIEYVNPKFHAISGYDSEEVIGKTPRILKSGEMSKEHYELLWKTITAGNVWRGEFHNRNKNGDLYWESGSISPILNDQGIISHFVAVMEDNTARKKAENLVRQQEIELAHVARLSTMGEMAAGLAHELNQPLGAISNYSNNSLHLLEMGDIDGLRRDLSEIPTIVHRCGEIIRRIRRFVKRQKPHRSTIKVPQLIRDVLSFVEHEARLNSIVVCHDSSKAPISMIADRVQLEQVLLNLALNSIEAMVASEREEKVLTLKAVRKGSNEVEFSVQDTGCGIPPDILGQVCDTFVTTKPNGLGMGLAICNTIVQAHHGLLEIASESGQGTLVRFTIPIKDEDR